jgi:signal transduction histidine kinase
MTTRILVVEDEPLIALDLKCRLERIGYLVVSTPESSDQALADVVEHQPDLILMDIHLSSEVTGIEVAVQIKDRFQIPVIFLTAHADGATLEQVKAAQPFGYIVKPFENEDLVTAIETALNRHEAELAIKNALIREKELTRLKSQFVSIVSHEFRNPLSVILTSFDLLEGYDQQLSFEQKVKYIRQGKNAVSVMSQLLEDVLVLGEIESSKLQCTPSPLALSTFCQNLIAEFQATIRHNRIIQFIEMERNTPTAPIEADERLLRHILTNLLSNAIKYSAPVDETAQDSDRPITLNLSYLPHQVMFQIADQGIGIPTGDLPHLFKSFHRGSNVSQIPGTGLGLNIVKQCVDAYGGEISVTSQVGKGTTFTVIIPY